MNGEVTLRFDDLRWGVGGHEIVRGVSGEARSGEVLGLVGPNGSGKTSLLRLLTGVRTPDAGRVNVEGRDITSFARKELAQHVAFVDQLAHAHDDYTIGQVVELGRAPYLRRFSPLTPHDREVVHHALDIMDLHGLAGKTWATCSGGERQRAHIARAFAQDTPVIVLDEPLNHLDVRHQVGLMAVLRRIAGEGRTVITSLHDLSVALRRCDALLVMADGRLDVAGSPLACLTPETIRQVFGVEATLETCSRGEPLLAFHDA